MPRKGKAATVDAQGNKIDDDLFDENNLSDDLDGKKGTRRRRKDGNAASKKKLLTDEFTPSSLKKLRACVFCKFVLNNEKWKKLEMCPNCPDSRGIDDTTDCFESVISLILPKKSWVAEWQRMQNLIPGVYAMAISDSVTVPDADDDYDEDFVDVDV